MEQAAFIRSLEKNIDGVSPGSLDAGTVLGSLAQWDSLAVLTVIALVQEQTGARLAGSAVNACVTVGDLHRLAHPASV